MTTTFKTLAIALTIAAGLAAVSSAASADTFPYPTFDQVSGH